MLGGYFIHEASAAPRHSKGPSPPLINTFHLLCKLCWELCSFLVIPKGLSSKPSPRRCRAPSFQLRQQQIPAFLAAFAGLQVHCSRFIAQGPAEDLHVPHHVLCFQPGKMSDSQALGLDPCAELSWECCQEFAGIWVGISGISSTMKAFRGSWKSPAARALCKAGAPGEKGEGV